MSERLREPHRKVLAFLAEVFDDCGMGYCTFAHIAADTGADSFPSAMTLYLYDEDDGIYPTKENCLAAAAARSE